MVLFVHEQFVSLYRQRGGGEVEGYVHSFIQTVIMIGCWMLSNYWTWGRIILSNCWGQMAPPDISKDAVVST